MVLDALRGGFVQPTQASYLLGTPVNNFHKLEAQLYMNATLVTKENKETALNTKRIKIPNVCENMGVRWIDDFEFVKELGIKFSCKIV